jgi:hypothetical protein
MGEAYDKREHSTKREVDDLTDYQKLNSLDGAGVLVNPQEIPLLNSSDEDDDAATASNRPPLASPPDAVTVYDADYNDGADFSVVDDEGQTNT